jgi:hypothetical protein
VVAVAASTAGRCNAAPKKVKAMNKLEEFVEGIPELRITGGRVYGVYGFLTEINGELWMDTHSHPPGGHKILSGGNCARAGRNRRVAAGNRRV